MSQYVWTEEGTELFLGIKDEKSQRYWIWNSGEMQLDITEAEMGEGLPEATLEIVEKPRAEVLHLEKKPVKIYVYHSASWNDLAWLSMFFVVGHMTSLETVVSQSCFMDIGWLMEVLCQPVPQNSQA